MMVQDGQLVQELGADFKEKWMQWQKKHFSILPRAQQNALEQVAGSADAKAKRDGARVRTCADRVRTRTDTMLLPLEEYAREPGHDAQRCVFGCGRVAFGCWGHGLAAESQLPLGKAGQLAPPLQTGGFKGGSTRAFEQSRLRRIILDACLIKSGNYLDALREKLEKEGSFNDP